MTSSSIGGHSTLKYFVSAMIAPMGRILSYQSMFKERDLAKPASHKVFTSVLFQLLED